METITLVLEGDRSSSSSSLPRWLVPPLVFMYKRVKESTLHVHTYAFLSKCTHAVLTGPFYVVLFIILVKLFLWLYIHRFLPQQPKTHCISPQFPTCRNTCFVWYVGIPGGMAQVAVMSPECRTSRTICPGSCPYFVYVMVHLVNTTLPATHVLITTCWHPFNLFL